MGEISLKFLDNIRVGRKLLGSFFLIVAILLIVGVIGVFSVITLNSYLDQMYTRQLVPTEELGSIGADIWRLRWKYRRICCITDEQGESTETERRSHQIDGLKHQAHIRNM